MGNKQVTNPLEKSKYKIEADAVTAATHPTSYHVVLAWNSFWLKNIWFFNILFKSAFSESESCLDSDKKMANQLPVLALNFELELSIVVVRFFHLCIYSNV